MSDATHRPGSDEEWQELISQLRRQPKPPLNPFFYARVRARLSAPHSAPRAKLPSWVRRPAYTILLGILILAVSGDAAALRAAAPASHPSQLAR
jgi:hypothetical protein